MRYEPGESTSSRANTSWRGPIWFPLNVLLIDALARFHDFHGAGLLVAHPRGSGVLRTLGEVAADLGERLIALFLPDENGHRPYQGEARGGPADPGALLFHEAFHGEDGRGLGASHQTGWTGLVASLIARKYGVLG